MKQTADEEKWDYEGFLSPLVLIRFAEYMHKHRASDNWQKGIPKDKYMKSMWRHFMNVWTIHRTTRHGPIMEDALCALLFNVMGYLYEVLEEKWICPRK